MIDAVLLLLVGFVTLRGLSAAPGRADMGLVIALVAYMLLLYYGMSFLAQDGRSTMAFIYILSALAMVIAGYAVLEFFIGKNIIYGSIVAEKVPVKAASASYHRSGSTLGSPVALGLFLVQVAPLLLFCYFRSPIGRRRIAWGLAVLLSAAALLLTFTKGSWVTALFLTSVMLVFLTWRRRHMSRDLKSGLFVLVAVSLAATLIFGIISFRDLKYNLTSKQREIESYSIRWLLWKGTPALIAAHPIDGVGVWQAQDRLYEILVSEGKDHPNKPLPIDNLYLTTLAEEGFIGLSLGAVTVLLIGRQVWRLIRLDKEHFQVVIPFAVSMLAVLVNGFTVDSLLVWPTMVVFWLSAGIIRSQAELMRVGVGSHN